MNLKTMLMAAALGLGAMPASSETAPVALIVAQGGLGDGSWNDAANAGFQAGLASTGLEGRAIESNDVVAQGEEIMRRAADADFGLVLSLEYSHGEAMEKLAPDYPDAKWVIYNQERKGANVASVLFGEHEGSYLAGVLAAQVTTTEGIEGINPDPILGVIAALKSPGIDKFVVGFIQGAKSVNPDIQVQVAYADTFGDPTKGEQMANAMFEGGADIVYHVAGGTGIGVIKAAEASGHFAIGVDTDQDGMAPGHVLTSMIKRVDVATEQMIKAYAEGKFPGGKTQVFGLAQNGVGLSDMQYTKALFPAAYLDKVAAAKAAIIAGEIKVWDVSAQGYPDFFK
jgi:basic membrane protein A